VLILCVTIFFNHFLSKINWITPPLAAWELAALMHVFLVAQKMMQFRGFEYASRKFNVGIKKLVLNTIGFFVLLKLITVFFEMKVKLDGNNVVQLLTIPKKAEAFNQFIHFIAPYILIMPLLFFFMVNYFARRHVIKQANKLGKIYTYQERYLSGLLKFVDLPVVLPFFVIFIYLKVVDRIFEPKIEDLVFGIIGCCLLIVSNLLTGVFDDHWSEVEKHRRIHSSGLV